MEWSVGPIDVRAPKPGPRGPYTKRFEQVTQSDDMNKVVGIGASLLIVLGILHAIHVGRSDDVEPYLWAASLFLIAQGVLTLIFLRHR